MYSTLPRSLRETKLVTNVKVEEDEEVLSARKAMVESKSPAELSAIKSLSDLPIPSRVSKMVARNQTGAASETKVELASNNKSTRLVCSHSNTGRDLMLQPNFQQSQHQWYVLHSPQIFKDGTGGVSEGQ